MKQTIVCVESPDFFLQELRRLAVEEGDRIVVVSQDERHRGDENVLAVDPRVEHERAVAEIGAAVGKPDAVITTQEMFLTQAAALADAFGVARNPLASVVASRDKARMKRIWFESGVRTPSGVYCCSAAELGGQLEALAFPVIAKPTMGFSSCGVRKVASADELSDQLGKIFLINSTVVAKERLQGAGFLVEEYVDGPEFSIDTVWFDGQPLCDGILSKGSANGPYFPDRLYYLAPLMSAEIALKIKDLSHQAVRALGVTHGATHTEIRFRGDEPFVLETTNRPGAGGLFYQLFTRSLGVDFHRLYYLAAVCGSLGELRDRAKGCFGNDVERAPDRDEYAFWYNLPHKGSGVIKEIRGIDDLRARPEIDLCLCYKQPGAVLYPEGLDPDYFCSLLGTYRCKTGDPAIEDYITSYDDALEVIF